jgi:hypothetical protein
VRLTIFVRWIVRPLRLRVLRFFALVVFESRQRSRFAARAEFGPWGRVSSKLSKGASGVALKVLLVIPLRIKVEPTSCTVTP